jgi:hypothetical protein
MVLRLCAGDDTAPCAGYRRLDKSVKQCALEARSTFEISGKTAIVVSHDAIRAADSETLAPKG